MSLGDVKGRIKVIEHLLYNERYHYLDEVGYTIAYTKPSTHKIEYAMVDNFDLEYLLHAFSDSLIIEKDNVSEVVLVADEHKNLHRQDGRVIEEIDIHDLANYFGLKVPKKVNTEEELMKYLVVQCYGRVSKDIRVENIEVYPCTDHGERFVVYNKGNMQRKFRLYHDRVNFSIPCSGEIRTEKIIEILNCNLPALVEVMSEHNKEMMDTKGDAFRGWEFA